MNYFKKIFIVTLIIFSLFALYCSSFATSDIVTALPTTDNTLSEEQTINTDFYNADDGNIVLDKILFGNGFIVSDTFTTSVNESVSGDLYVIADTITLKSDVTYSDEQDKEGNQSIVSINASTCIFGNVFAIAKNFVIEPGVEIDGNLYVIAEEVTLSSQSKIYGNCYVCSDNLSLNSQIANSLYAVTKTFNMGYYGFVYRDLNLNAGQSELNGSIYRNAKIESKVITLEDNFSVYGNLDYSSEKELTFSDTMVGGKTTYSEYVVTNTTQEIILNALLAVIAFVFYVFIAFIIIKCLFKNYLEKDASLTVKNVLLSLVIGMVLIIAIPAITFVLFITPVGYMLSFALIATFAFILAISIPIFIIDIAKMSKKNLLPTVLIIAIIVELISLIPVVGFTFMSLLTLISIGNLTLKVFSKKQ